MCDFLVRHFHLQETVLLTSLCYWHEFVAAQGQHKINEVVLAVTCVFLGAKVEHAHLRLTRLLETAFDLDTTSSGSEMEQWCRSVLDVELILCDTIRFDFVRIFPLADTLKSWQQTAASLSVDSGVVQQVSTAVRRVFLFSFVTPLCTKVSMQKLCTAILYMVASAAQRSLGSLLKPIWSNPQSEFPDESELEGITAALMDAFAYLRKKFGVAALDEMNEARYKRRRPLNSNDMGIPSSAFSSASTDFTPLMKMTEQ